MDNKVLNDDFSRVKIQLRERTARRKCFWCKKHILKDGCDPGCQCTSCFFYNEIDLASDSAYSYKWLKNNMKFYKKLFYEGIFLERELIDKWKKGQQNTIDESGSKINDWFTDLEEKNSKNKLIPNDPEYYINNQIIPSVDKIFEALGYNINDLLKLKEQSELQTFFKK